MKHLSFSLSLIILSVASFAQNMHADLFVGISNYQGDLQGKRFTLNQSHPAIGLGVSYDLSTKFVIRTGLTYGKVEGNDKKNTTAKGIEFRNLNFKSNITELQLQLNTTCLI